VLGINKTPSHLFKKNFPYFELLDLKCFHVLLMEKEPYYGKKVLKKNWK